MRVGRKTGDKIAIPQAEKRFGYTAKNLTQFFNIFLRVVGNINANDRNYSG